MFGWLILTKDAPMIDIDDLHQRYCELRDKVLSEPGINNNHLVEEFLAAIEPIQPVSN